MLNILAIGDICEPRAVSFIIEELRRFAKAERVDFVIANGENAGFILGPTPALAEMLLDGGIDCVTGGNHTLQNKSLHPLLDSEPRLLRPANYPPEVPGSGAYLAKVGGVRLLVLNVMGQVHIEPPLSSPFHCVKRLLERYAGEYDVAVLDIHAEATGEKQALGYCFDGSFAAIFGTHTHIPTADECILPKGTGYVTDIGMCGAEHSVLGVDRNSIIERYMTALPIRPELPEGKLFATGVLFTVDERTNSCTAVRRIRFSEK